MFFKNNYNIFDIIVGNNYVTEKKTYDGSFLSQSRG